MDYNLMIFCGGLILGLVEIVLLFWFLIRPTTKAGKKRMKEGKNVYGIF